MEQRNTVCLEQLDYLDLTPADLSTKVFALGFLDLGISTKVHLSYLIENQTIAFWP